eukprot:6136750-Ditylum_brightwellii.AAC.1
MGHLSSIKFTECKPEPLETEFKSIYVPLLLNVITDVSLCLVAKTKLCGQEKPTVDEDEDKEDRSSNFPFSDLFQGGSLFASISTVEHMMELGHQLKGVMNTAHSLYPKDWLETTMKNYP